jgi:3-methyl-2-oxobutanoate hydroxymethyltransferase
MGITAATLRSMKVKGTKFAGLVLYDACFARLAREAGIEVSVVGDSVGMSVLGHPTTVATTMDDMVYHTRAAAMGHGDGLLIGDLPFMSYATLDMAVRNAALLMQAGAHMVKLEGGGTWATETVAFLVQRGIPVCGHIGLTPQSFHKLGGHRVQGKVPEEATRLLAESRALQDAGAELLVLECVPRDLAIAMDACPRTHDRDIQVLRYFSGQVLLAYDVLGLTGSKLRFAKDYLKNGACGSLAAFRQFAEEVRAGQFPGDEHSFGLEGAKLA